MNGFRLLIFCAILPLIAGCTKIGLEVANLPAHYGTATVIRDVLYSSESWAKADIYIPRDAYLKPRDVVVFYYGGRWESGKKEDYGFVGAALARNNIITVIPDYRKYPDVRFPDFVNDAAKALAWTSDHIGEYGGAANRIHVAGHSAGAHIGALLATDEHYLKALGKSRSVIQDFVGLAGPYSFTPEDKDLIDIFGPPNRYPQMQVTTFVDGKQPPMLLLWGGDDTSVKQYNMDRLAASIHKKGGCVQTKIYPGVDHVWILGGLTWFGDDNIPVLKDMVRFFRNNGC